jgi:hypothetical protein
METIEQKIERKKNNSYQERSSSMKAASSRPLSIFKLILGQSLLSADATDASAGRFFFWGVNLLSR